MSRWIDIENKWRTETTYRIRELLKENRIPFRMPSDEMFFQSMYHLPNKDRIWGIKVRQKDLDRVLSLLAKEGLIHSPVQQARQAPEQEPVSFRRKRIGAFPAVLRKRWPAPRPGTGNT